ncbi:restriction endonuclease subunit S [Nonomuraea sp. LPB2021202275-12-8]|uniref:restriction endonuclease subunit S n=1 Tax=Nonomuraea sp. LPB2021202275-12-8 TaxID=3120159 RepID=UPI00300C72A7
MSWTATRLKHLCVDAGQYGLNISAQDYTPSGHRLIRTSDIDENGGLRPRENAVFVDTSLDGRHELKSGDLLLSRSGTLGRAMLLRDLEEPSTYAGYLVRFRPRPSTEPRFMAYLAASHTFQAAIEADAVTSTIQNFNAERYANIAVSLPSLDEQRRIADFLDAETARIDQLISLRSLQLGQLDERETSWRSEIFLGSESGVWVRVKHLLRAKPRYGVLVPELVDEGVPFIRVNNLAGSSTRDSLASIPQKLSDQYPRTVTVLGDVLLSVVGTLGKVAVVTEDLVGANTARAVAVLRLDPKHEPSLFAAWIGTAGFRQQALLATGADSAQPTLGMEDLANFSVRWPVDESEQKKMAAAAMDRQIEASETINALGRQLALLAERRQALITAAVTGQVDVTTARGADMSGLSPAGGV